MEKQQFQAESKRLLDLMINSIYTHKEIFLRELVSNASDAMDRLYYLALTEEDVHFSREDFRIELKADKKERTLSIRDNGIGMTREELENNLGTIARSGSLLFKNEQDKEKTGDEIDVIGQFGVGFYSAFMVSRKVTVHTRSYKEETGYIWESDGADGYTIEECPKDTIGTELVLYLKENTEEENYDEFLQQYRLQELIKKYSDYIRYPIQMEMHRSRVKEGSDEKNPEYEDYTEIETLNSMVPLWKRSKSEITEEEYAHFYKEKFMDFRDPLTVLHTNVEGNLTYTALLFIPSETPYNFYTRDYEKGLQLYSSGVFIMDKCADLLPEYFRFVRGLVDSQDLSLNISREMLQHDRQLKAIEKNLEKKIKAELLKMLNNDREKYEAFFKHFGLQLKYGVYGNYGENKDLLKDLLLYYSSSEEKMVTLEEYVSRMKEDQKCIYYAAGESIAKLDRMPQSERVKEKGYEILYMTDDVDEFAIQMMQDYDGKEFKSVNSGNLELESDEEKKELEEKTEANKDLLTALKDALTDKVKDVRVSARLKSHPVCLTSDGGLTMEMEKVLSAYPGAEKDVIKADKILEINGEHPVFAALQKVYAKDSAAVAEYAGLLYDQALLIEGFAIEDPVAFSNRICQLMVDANAAE